MPEQNTESFLEEQKKLRPKIEDVIPQYLNGDLKQSALDFVAYLRANKLSPTWTSVNSWKCSYKGKALLYLKLSIKSWKVCYMHFDNKEFNAYDFDEDLRDFCWSHPHYCRQKSCHYRACAKNTNQDEETYNGVKREILGKEFENICKNVPGIDIPNNPDEQTIGKIKMIIEYSKQAIEANMVSKDK